MKSVPKKRTKVTMRNIQPSNRLLVGVLLAFLLAISVTAYLTFEAVRDLVVSWRITGLESERFIPSAVSVSSPDAAGPAPTIDPSMPLQPAGGPTLEPWDGSSRVTVLVMGVDFRDWEEGNGPPRTDTMMLLTVDPNTKSAGMLSIPRDLWVSIPGFEHGKINTAYQLGEAYDLPGGGAGLAVATVEKLIGLPINFYAQVDFGAFIRVVDEIEGVKVVVPEEIKVDPLGRNNTKVLKPGVQTLTGELALAYARARNTPGGDFDRAKRQQQVILAFRNRVLSFDLIPILLTKAPILFQEIASGITTNMTLDQAIQLGLLVQQIPEDNIRRGVIGPDQVTFGFSLNGQYILNPIPDQVRLLRDQIFTTSGPVSLVEQSRPPEQLMQDEAARIAVLNGTQTPGLASRTTEFLEGKDLNITMTGNANQAYDDTTLIDYTGNPYTLQYLVDLMDINPNRIFHSFNPDSEVDVEINLGLDWAASGKLP